MFLRELPEAACQLEQILAILRLALIPACRDSRGAQDDRVEDIRQTETSTDVSGLLLSC